MTPFHFGMSRAQEIVDRIHEVCPLPASVQRVLSKIDDPRCSATDLAACVALDASLAAEVLRLSNSPFYGRPRGVETLAEAVLTLGFHEIRTIATTMAMFAAFASEHEQAPRLHERAVCRGALAGALASRLRVSAPKAYLCGLFAEIGALACLALDPAGYGRLLKETDGDTARREGLERLQFGATSRWIGAALLRGNGLPEPIAAAVEAADEELNSDPFTKLTKAVRRATGEAVEPESVSLALAEALAWQGWPTSPEQVGPIVAEAFANVGSLMRAAS